MRWLADSLDLASEPIAEFYRRPNPKTAILQANDHAAGWIGEPVEIDVVPINDPNILGNWNKGGHRKRLSCGDIQDAAEC